MRHELDTKSVIDDLVKLSMPFFHDVTVYRFYHLIVGVTHRVGDIEHRDAETDKGRTIEVTQIVKTERMNAESRNRLLQFVI